jgi:hypothetical protein
MDLPYNRDAFVDGEAGGGDVAFDFGIAFEDQTVLDGDIAFDFTGDLGFIEIHVGFDKSFRTNDDFAVAFELSFEDAIDADFSLESDFTGDSDIGSDSHFRAGVGLLIFVVGSICLNERGGSNGCSAVFLNTPV